jgi:hypothetical protein
MKSEGEGDDLCSDISQIHTCIPFVNRACLVNLKSERNPSRIPCNSEIYKLFTPSSFLANPDLSPTNSGQH